MNTIHIKKNECVFNSDEYIRKSTNAFNTVIEAFTEKTDECI